MIVLGWTGWLLSGVIILGAILYSSKRILSDKSSQRSRFRSPRYLAFFMAGYAVISSWIKAGLMLYRDNWDAELLLSQSLTLLFSVSLVGLVMYMIFVAPTPNRANNTQEEQEKQQDEQQDEQQDGNNPKT